MGFGVKQGRSGQAYEFLTNITASSPGSSAEPVANLPHQKTLILSHFRPIDRFFFM
ncbi:hypothetical protein MHH28_13315 [Paenibacillus sp. FSL K6-1217]|uniref:hypothetical protein n=1 Tax=Paenibacillus sp. FSL K6-1217 TaxID=2921466 RepID=UPI00324414FD